MDRLHEWILWKGWILPTDGKRRINIDVTEQKDRLFTGNISYTLNGTKVVEGFAGAIGLDNKTFYIAEFKEGYDYGAIISGDEIELIYLQDGTMGWASTDEFHRVKAWSAYPELFLSKWTIAFPGGATKIGKGLPSRFLHLACIRVCTLPEGQTLVRRLIYWPLTMRDL
jgi:hypothetical protein